MMPQEICNYCQVKRNKNYIGGGLWTWTCSKCGHIVKSNTADMSAPHKANKQKI